MNSSMSGEVAIVTGAGGTLGRAQAIALAHAGARVVLTDIDEASAVEAATAIGPSAVAMHHDVSSPESWDEVVREVADLWRGFTVLVNNAGAYEPVPLVDTTVENWDRHVSTIQFGTYLGLRHAATAPTARAVVNIVSSVALNGYPGMFAYHAAKSAVRGMSRAAALELPPRVRVNAVFPGFVETPLSLKGGPQFIERVLSTIPLARPGQPEDIAAAVLHLASPAAAFSTGAELVVDGGTHA